MSTREVASVENDRQIVPPKYCHYGRVPDRLVRAEDLRMSLLSSIHHPPPQPQPFMAIGTLSVIVRWDSDRLDRPSFGDNDL